MGFIDKKETKVAQSLRNENSIKGWKCILESVEHSPLDASYSAKSLLSLIVVAVLTVLAHI